MLTLVELLAAQAKLDRRAAALRSLGWQRWVTGPAYDRRDVVEWTLDRIDRKRAAK